MRWLLTVLLALVAGLAFWAAYRCFRSAKPPGLPEDGEPLTHAEMRTLAAITLDARDDIPEPVYGKQQRREESP